MFKTRKNTLWYVSAFALVVLASYSLYHYISSIPSDRVLEIREARESASWEREVPDPLQGKTWWRGSDRATQDRKIPVKCGEHYTKYLDGQVDKHFSHGFEHHDAKYMSFDDYVQIRFTERPQNHRRSTVYIKVENERLLLYKDSDFEERLSGLGFPISEIPCK